MTSCLRLHLHYIDQVLGKRAGAHVYAAMNFLILPERQLAMVDTHVNENPSAEQLAEITILAAEEMARFGMCPRAALLSHSNFGSANNESALKMRAALALVRQQAPEGEVDGEMHGDTALDTKLRKSMKPKSNLKGDANLLVMPNIDAANNAYNLLKTAAGSGIAIGSVLLGCAEPVRRIVNMTALCASTRSRRASQKTPPPYTEDEIHDNELGRLPANGMRPRKCSPGRLTRRDMCAPT